MITLKNISKIYAGSKQPAVKNLSLQIQKGEVFGLLGPNGAGKTTTVKMLVGLMSPSSGSVQIFGKSPHEKIVRQRIGFFPENPYFYQYLTATEFLRMCADIFDIPASKAQKKIEEVLSLVHLQPEAWESKIHTYSKGMQQRLGLAQALINDPELIILDEPMSGLDPLGRAEVKEIILQLKKQGKTLFFNSHILADVEDLCTRVAIIDRGQNILEGTVAEVTKNGKHSLEQIFVRTISEHRA